jgi:hypothetical protein
LKYIPTPNTSRQPMWLQTKKTLLHFMN